MSIYTSRTGSPYAEREEAAPGEDDGWEATRVQTALATQVMSRLSDGSTPTRQDIGREVGNNVRELFVACAPGEALQQQFEHLRPDYIAVHDLATRSSRQLLRGIAAASSRAVQKLVLRRQGFGTPVATIDFVEVPLSATELLRIYSTDIDDAADPATKHAVARTLLAYSQLGVMMVGNLPEATMHSTLRPWHDEMSRSPWINRTLLLLPLTSTTTLVNVGQEMVRGTSITLRTTPMVTRPADAWNFINSTWSRLRGAMPAAAGAQAAGFGGAAAAATAAPRDASGFAATTMLPMRPMPPVAPRPEPVRDRVLEGYAQAVCELAGVVGCCLFDVGSGNPVMHAGSGAPPDDLARHGRALMSAIGTTSRSLGLGHTPPEAAITLGAHHLLLRPVPKHAGLALLVVLDRTNANLTLARLQIERLDPRLSR